MRQAYDYWQDQPGIFLGSLFFTQLLPIQTVRNTILIGRYHAQSKPEIEPKPSFKFFLRRVTKYLSLISKNPLEGLKTATIAAILFLTKLQFANLSSSLTFHIRNLSSQALKQLYKTTPKGIVNNCARLFSTCHAFAMSYLQEYLTTSRGVAHNF